MKGIKNNKFLIVYLLLLVVIVTNIVFRVQKDNITLPVTYTEFNEEWKYNGVDINLQNIAQYEKVYKVIPKLEENSQIFINVESMKLDVYIGDECIYKYDESHTNSKVFGDYFIRVDIDKDDAGKLVTLDVIEVVEEDQARINDIYIGDATNITDNYISMHLMEFIISAIIIFMGFVLIVVFIIFKFRKTKGFKTLNLGIYALMCGVYLLLDTGIIQLLYNEMCLFNFIKMLVLFLFMIPLLLFLKEVYFKTTNRLVMDIVCFINLLCFVGCYILDYKNIYSCSQIMLILYVTYFITLLYIFYLCIKSFIDGDEKEDWHTISLLILFICIILDKLVISYCAKLSMNCLIEAGLLVFVCIESIQIMLEYFKDNQDSVEQLAKLAYYDGLTGLLNRTAFMEDFKKMKDCSRGLIAVFDINNLKYVNDNFGHQSGDELIKKVTKTLKEQLDKYGRCYRIGGDELVFLSDDKDIDKKFIQANEQITNILTKYNKRSSKKYDVSVAVGYCEITNKTGIIKAFKIADANMYENKEKMKKEHKK